MWSIETATKAFKLLTLFAFLATSLAIAADDEPMAVPTARANCELRMLQPSEAGSIYLSTFASSREDCLKLSDERTKAEFKPVPRRGRTPVGPKED